VLGLLCLVVGSSIAISLISVIEVVLVPGVRRRLRRRLATTGNVDDVPARVDGAAWAGKTVFILAGEPSGDRLAAPVVGALRRLAPGVRLRGYAGPACAAQGVALDDDLTAHAVVGLIPVLKTLPTWWRVCARFHALLREQPPDLLVTVDYPGLNVRLARWARKRGVRTVHVVAPAVWAYGRVRALRWRRAVDRVLALYPHEPPLLATSGLTTLYVGHPLFEAPLPPPRTPAGLPASGELVVELLPGSRRGELLRHVPAMVEAAAEAERSHPRLGFVMRLAEERHRAAVEQHLATARARPTRLRIDVGVQPLPGPLVAALASSGTVTAELGAALVPMVVTYGVSPFARVGAALWLTAPWFALVNLVAGREVARERLFVRQGPAGARLAADLRALLASPEAWARARADLEPVRARLEREGVAARTARALLAP
jgi:lipid-A-disaccharide synthase